MKKKSQMICCQLCGYSTKFQSWFKRHLLTHDDVRTIICNECGSQFKTTSAYNLHVREKHGTNNTNVCQTCGLAFTQRRALERHLLCHSDDKPIACTHCGYRCKRKQDLDRHLRTMHSAGKARRKRHEEFLAGFFRTLQITFTREFTVKVDTFGGRRSARIDFFIPMSFGWLLFECDELQHSSYTVAHECQRMQAIWEHHRQRYPDERLHIVRYNSHAYKQDGTIVKPTQEERVASIKESLAYIPETKFVITYLYYRTTAGFPAVTLDPEYTLKEYVRGGLENAFVRPAVRATTCDINAQTLV